MGQRLPKNSIPTNPIVGEAGNLPFSLPVPFCPVPPVPCFPSVLSLVPCPVPGRLRERKRPRRAIPVAPPLR
ncbi:MAG: hypothetical protein LKKZDAJK_002726 [Candidatus Fervidibacter sp.]